MKLEIDNVFLSVIDVQEKLIGSIFNKYAIINNIVKLIKICKKLNLPIILSEQYPKGIGKTIPKLTNELENFTYIEKTKFSCFSEKDYKLEVLKNKKKQALLCGIETHICVLQTAIELKEGGYDVFIIADSIGSRKKVDHELGLNFFRNNKLNLLSLEMLIFCLLKDSKHENFKELSKLIK